MLRKETFCLLFCLTIQAHFIYAQDNGLINKNFCKQFNEKVYELSGLDTIPLCLNGIAVIRFEVTEKFEIVNLRCSDISDKIIELNLCRAIKKTDSLWQKFFNDKFTPISVVLPIYFDDNTGCGIEASSWKRKNKTDTKDTLKSVDQNNKKFILYKSNKDKILMKSSLKILSNENREPYISYVFPVIYIQRRE